MTSGNFHVPQHPLPEEIEAMKIDDTVCKFCGISYLIHREVKRLQDELDVCKKELTSLRGVAEREQVAKAEIETWRAKFEAGENETGKMKDRFDSLKQENELLNMTLRNVDGENTTLKHEAIIHKEKIKLSGKKFKMLIQTIRHCHQEIKELRRNHTTLNEDMLRLTKTVRSKVTDLLFCFSEIKEKFTTSEEILQGALTKRDHEIIELRSQLNATDSKTASVETQLNSREKQLLEYQAKLKQRETEVNLLRTKSGKLSDTLETKCQEMREFQDQNSKQVAKLRSAVETLKHENEVQGKDLEEKTADVAETKKICEELKAISERLKCEQELKDRDTTNAHDEIKVLRLTSTIAREELSKMKQQRQNDTHMHQKQLSDMRDSYNEKLTNAAHVTSESQNEIAKLRKTFELEKEALKTRHAEELCNQEQVSDREQQRMKIDLEAKLQSVSSERDSARTKARSESSRWKTLLEEGEMRLLTLKRDYEAEKSDLLHQLNETIDDLQAAKTSSGNSSRRRFDESHRALALANDEISRLQDVEVSLSKKVAELQETVRNECEERIELTQSLCDARAQVLAYQRTATSFQSQTSEKSATSPMRSSTSSSNRISLSRKLSRPRQDRRLTSNNDNEVSSNKF